MCPHDRKLSGQALRKTLEQPHREHPGRTAKRNIPAERETLEQLHGEHAGITATSSVTSRQNGNCSRSEERAAPITPNPLCVRIILQFLVCQFCQSVFY